MSSVGNALARPLWLDQTDPIPERARLDGDLDVDVAIAGGGFSGLWTAYYLSRLDSTLRIAVVDKHHCGYGASGRNGGWCVGELAGSFEKYARLSSADGSRRLSRAMFDSVDEVGRVVEAEGIECGYAKGGTIRVARTGPQAARQAEEVAEMQALGFTEDEIRLLTAEEARSYLNATDVRSGIFFPPSAALHPARLAMGLAATIEGRGVSVYEQTAVTAIEPGRLITDRGVVSAPVVIRATEAYTRDLAGERRTLLPVYSLMIATEPLDDEVFDQIGLADRPTFADDRYMVIYGQRTADNRIAFGSRGVPYLYGSRISAANEYDQAAHERIRDVLVELLPPLADAAITHRWGGVLAIPRNWTPGLTFDRATGLGTLGGYVGEGVAAANLAGRTMAELVAGESTERTSLPWVGATARRWEPEPFRWLGVHAGYRFLEAADNREAARDGEAKLATRVARLLRG